MRRKDKNAVFAFIGVVFLIVLVVSCTASVVANAAQSRCGAPYRASGKHSLQWEATWTAHSPVSQVLADTLACTPKRGGFPRFYPALESYVNKGDLVHPHLIPGTRLWFSVLP